MDFIYLAGEIHFWARDQQEKKGNAITLHGCIIVCRSNSQTKIWRRGIQKAIQFKRSNYDEKIFKKDCLAVSKGLNCFVNKQDFL